MSTSPLRVCVDARFIDGTVGGVQHAVIDLCHGFGTIADSTGDLVLQFLVWDGHGDWLTPHLPPGAALLPCPPLEESTTRGTVKRIPGLRPLWRWLRTHLTGPPRPPASDGAIESAGIEVMHFTHQLGFRTAVPSIYQPHDLQHVHLPELFTDADRRLRDGIYRFLCDQARCVVMMTTWGANDVITQYGLSPDRVAVVPHGAAPAEGAPGATIADLSALDLPAQYALFPARTWPHKNHLRLLDALALLRDTQGLVVPVMCTGGRSEHHAAIEHRRAELGLDAQMRFLGYLKRDELQALYRGAHALLFPSRFEGWGLPITEAFAWGVPVACSTATGLPGVTGGAAEMFAPKDAAGMARAVETVWTDDARRAELVRLGRTRLSELSLANTARRYAALYRRTAGRTLSSDDEALLASPPPA